MNAVREFLDEHRRCRTKAELLSSFRDALRDLGLNEVDCYGVAAIRPSGAIEPIFITSTLDPALSEEYLRRRSYREDPAVIFALRRVSPFFYEDMFEAGPETVEVRRMEEAFGPRSGIVVPLHQVDGTLAVVCAGSRAPAAALRAEGWELLARVQHLSAVMHERAQMLAARAVGRPASADIVLTPRERECLIRVADGKSSSEIGETLAITERTVKKHVQSAMTKLEVKTRAQAVVKAMAEGLIN